MAPQPIENRLKESPFVEQVIVVGAERKFVGALIVPSFTMLREWMRENNLPFTTPEDAISNPQVLGHYRQLVESFNKYFNQVEQIKKEGFPDLSKLPISIRRELADFMEDEQT